MTDASEGPRSKAVEYTLDDFQALARHVETQLVGRLRILAFLLFVFAILTIGFEWSVAPSEFELWPIILQLALAVAFYLISSTRFRAHLWLNLARRSPFFAPHSFAITPSALLVISDKARSEVLWTAIPKVVVDKAHLFLFMSSRTAYIVPDRAFDGQEEFAAFAASALERWEQSRGQ